MHISSFADRSYGNTDEIMLLHEFEQSIFQQTFCHAYTTVFMLLCHFFLPLSDISRKSVDFKTHLKILIVDYATDCSILRLQ